MNFSVGGEKSIIRNNEVLVGAVPGRFDAKQIVLSALIVLKYSKEGKEISIIRSLDKEQLEKCSYFITDGFASKFPAIPSYSSVSRFWNKFGSEICNYAYEEADSNITASYAKKNICSIEYFDILLEYNSSCFLGENENENFEKAVNIAIDIIKQIISSAAIKAKMYYTLQAYLDEAEENILYLPFSMGTNIVLDEKSKQKIEWIITKEGDNIYLLEAVSKKIDIRQIVKDRREVIYAGRYFCKVTSLEIAKSLIPVINLALGKIA